MNARERFRRMMDFEAADGLPLMEVEAYDQVALERWHKEGLPAKTSPADALGIKSPEALPIDFFPVPHYEERVLEENDDYVIAINFYGCKVKRPKDQSHYTYEGFLEHPVKCRDDWLRYRERLDADSPGRFPDDWGPEMWGRYNSADRPVGLGIHPFFFRLGLYGMGLENFMMAFYDQPDLLHEMFDHRAEMSVKIIEKVVAHVKIDYCCIAEDLAFRHSTHISPAMYREFWSPHQPQVIEALKRGGVRYIVMWSSGDLRPLLPLFIEAGFNATWPCEDFAGMNVNELAKEYGRDMRFVGNIGIRSVAQGKEAIDREIETKVIPAIERGGYVPTLDDAAPPEISWGNYCYYVNRLKEL